MSATIQPGDLAFDRTSRLVLGVVESVYNFEGADLVVVVDTPRPDSHRTRVRQFPTADVFTRQHDRLPIVINDTWDPKAGHYEGVGS